MPKSQIIKDIVENKVSLEQSLNRLYILAADVKNKQLGEWAQKELNGYEQTDELPPYRHVSNLHFKYTGINGGFQVTNVPLPLEFLKPETIKQYAVIKMTNGIRFIEDLANSHEMASRDLTILAPEVSEITHGAVSCISIFQEIPQSIPIAICAEVKSKMLNALLELEKRYGNLDSLGIDISGKNSIQIDADNEELNRAVFNINLPSTPQAKKQPWYSKVFWNVIIPIIPGIVVALLAAFIINLFHW